MKLLVCSKKFAIVNSACSSNCIGKCSTKCGGKCTGLFGL